MSITMLLSFLVFFNCIIHSQKNEGEKLIKDFVVVLLDNKKSNEAIVEEYMKLNARSKDEFKQISDVLNLQLDDIRKRLDSCPHDVSISPYNEVDQDDFFEICDEDLSNVFFVTCGDTVILPFKISKNRDKIVAFSTMNKGGKRFFMVF